MTSTTPVKQGSKAKSEAKKKSTYPSRHYTTSFAPIGEETAQRRNIIHVVLRNICKVPVVDMILEPPSLEFQSVSVRPPLSDLVNDHPRIYVLDTNETAREGGFFFVFSHPSPLRLAHGPVSIVIERHVNPCHNTRSSVAEPQPCVYR